MTPQGRRRVHRLLAAGGVLGLVLTGALLLLGTGPGNRLMARGLVRLVEGRLGEGTLEIGALHTRLVDGIVLRQVALRNKDGRLLIGVDRVLITWDLARLPERHLELSRLRLDGPVVDLGPSPSGRMALLEVLGIPEGDPNGTPSRWQGLPGEIDVQSLELRGGELRWAGGALDRIELDSKVHLSGDTAFLSGAQARGDLTGPLGGEIGLRLDGGLADGHLRLDRAGLRYEQSQLDLEGMVASIETAPILDLRWSSERVRAGDLARISGLEGIPGVDLALHGELRGPLEDLVGSLAVDAGAGGGLQWQGSADLEAPTPQWAFTLDGQGLDSRRLSPGRPAEPLRVQDLHLGAEGEGLSWPGDLEADLQLQLVGFDALGERFERLDLAGTVSGGRIELSELLLAHLSGEVRGSGTLDPAGQQLLLDLQAELPRLEALSGLAGMPLAGAGRWSPSLRLAWADALLIEGRGPASVRGLQVAGVQVEDGRGPVHLRWTEGSLAMDGSTRASGLRGQDWALGRAEGDWELVRSATGQLELLARVQAEAAELPAQGTRLATASGRVQLSLSPEGQRKLESQLDLTGLVLRPGALPAEGRLQLTLDGDALQASLVAPGADGAPVLSGSVQGRLGGEGTWRVADLRLELLPGLAFQAEEDLVLVMDAQGIRSLDGSLVGPAGRLHARTDPATGRLHLDATGLDLNAWERLSALAAGGGSIAPGLRGMAELSMDLDRGPGAGFGTIDAHLAIAGLDWPERVQEVDLDFDLEGPLSRPGLRLELRGEGERLLALRGKLPLDLERRRLDCAGELALEAVVLPGPYARLRAHLPGLPEADLDLSAALQASGDPCDPRLHLVAAGHSALGREGERVRLDLVLDRDGDRLQTELFVEQGFERRFRVGGGAATDLGTVLAALQAGRALPEDWASDLVGEMALSIEPRGVPIDALRGFVRLPASLDGTLGGAFLLTGSPRAPRAQGALQLTAGRIGRVPVELGLLQLIPSETGYSADLRLDFGAPAERPGALVEPESSAPEGERSFVLTSQLPLEVGASFQELLDRPGFVLQADGVLPLALLEGTVSQVGEAGGELALHLKATGTARDPRIAASLRMQGGMVELPPLGLRYEDIELVVDASEDLVRIERLAMNNRRSWQRVNANRSRSAGHAELEGNVRLAGLKATRVTGTAKLQDFWILGQPDRVLALSGQGRVEGSWPALSVRGDLELSQSELFFGEDFFAGESRLQVDPIIQLQRTRTLTVASAGEAAPAFWRAFELDLGIDLLRNLRLEAEVPLQESYGEQLASLSKVGLRAELGGELRLLQHDGALVLQGTMETLRGTATVFGVPFDVRGGNIAFLGDGYDNPLVDITAVRSTRYGDVDVKVDGFVDNLKIEPSSEEYPDMTDVVSLLLFGVPASKVQDSQAQNAESAYGMALATLSGQVSRVLGTRFVDQLEYDATGAIRVGKALSDRLFLRLEQRLNTDDEGNRTELTLEYLITRRLYAEFVTGDRGASSAHLYWRWRF